MVPKHLALSIVVPSKGRAEVLRKCIEHLLHQTISPDRYEILVIDDDSTDESERIVRDSQPDAACEITYSRGPGRGVAAARNSGVRMARAPITLLIGNDTIAEPDLLSEHLRFHQIYPDEHCAVLGRTKLHPDSRRSPFMETWGDLPYWEIEGHLEVPCSYFWTGNISVKTRFFLSYGMFDEGFRKIGFEDTEIGFRLSQHGLQILYNNEAIGYHDHPYSLDEACRQQLSHGYNFGLLMEKLTSLGLGHQLPFLAEKYGIVGRYRTKRGMMKSVVKRWVLHNRLVMRPLEKWLNRTAKPGPIATFMYPKLFSYYTNLGYLQYEAEKRAGGRQHGQPVLRSDVSEEGR